MKMTTEEKKALMIERKIPSFSYRDISDKSR